MEAGGKRTKHNCDAAVSEQDLLFLLPLVCPSEFNLEEKLIFYLVILQELQRQLLPFYTLKFPLSKINLISVLPH